MKKPHILIVEADTAAQRQYRAALTKLDSPELCFVPSAPAAEQKLRSGSVDLLIAGVDSNPGELELLRTARQLDAELPMIVVTAAPDVASATASLRLARATISPSRWMPTHWPRVPRGCWANDDSRRNTNCSAARSSNPIASTT